MLEMIQHHHPGLLLLALAYSFFSGLVAMQMFARAGSSFGRISLLWTCLGAGALAIGIWSAQSLGHLGLWQAAPKLFALKGVIFSAITMFAAACAASYLVSQKQPYIFRLAGSCVLTAGVVLACIFGVKSVQITDVLSWDYQSLLISILLACCFIAAAFHLTHVKKTLSARLLAACFLVMATSGFYLSATRILLTETPDHGAVAATIISSLPLYFAIAFLGLFFCILVAAGYCLDRFVRKNSAHIAYLDTLVDQLKRSEKKAIDAERSKSDFVADISHELRTPLNGIIGMHRLALDGKLSQEQRERIEMADEAAEALLTLVNDILDLSQIEADKFQLEEKTFSVRRLLDSVTTLMSPACLEKGLSLDISIDQDVPQWIKGDKDRLRQILFNIVGNAIKFTDRGGVCVFVTTTRVEGDTISLNIVVEDTGIGMSKETLERLFERYSRANDEASKRIGGAGLGLSISKRLAVAMGGDITVTSEPDVGSAFDIHIKCQESTQPLTSPTQECAPPDFEPLSILVADDNKLNQKIVSELLTRRGHKCNIVANGRDAVAAWRHNAYDVIFMDIHMPNGDGVEASRQIRSSDSPRASVPIIALTASASSKVDALRKSAGIDGFVAKPIEPELLWAELDRCVQKASDSGQKRAIDATVSPTGLPLLDKARLAVLSDIFGEKELYEQLDEVLAESARILREIALALKSGNLNSAKQTAHTLNGMAGNWAATRIGDIARRIESESPTIRRASKYALELYEAVDLTKQAVSQYKNGY